MSTRRGPKVSLSEENKAWQEQERVTFCHCGRVAQKYDNVCKSCRLNPSCRCSRPIWDGMYGGQRFDKRCGRLEAA